MKRFYINYLGLDLVSEEEGRHVFLKVENMLLIFSPENRLRNLNNIFSIHGTISPPSILHLAFETKNEDYGNRKRLLETNNINIKKN